MNHKSDDIASLKARVKDLEAQLEKLEFERKQLDLVVKSTGVGIWDWNIQTGETEFNERWANIIGYTLEELSPVSIETWMKHAHPDDLKESDRLLRKHWEGKTEYYIFESRMKHKNGKWIWVYDTGQVIEWESDGRPRRMIGTHLDITKQKEDQIRLDRANKKLFDLSYIDPLTRIPNRRAYEERLAREVRAAKRANKPLSFMIVDIDHFKQYNDTYGHENGDLALSRVADIIKTSLPRETDFVARYGGEELVVILPYTDHQGAKLVAERIIGNIIAANIEHSASPFRQKLTVSIGVSTTETTFGELLVRADKALYLAKKNGRNRHEVYSEELANIGTNKRGDV